MPIKDIIVDWGSSRPRAGNSPGKYKNRKQYCQPDNTTPVAVCREDKNVTCTASVSQEGGGRTCVTNNTLGACEFSGTMFGSSPDACDPGYYEFIGAYAFDAGDNINCGYTIGGRSPGNFGQANLTTLTSQYGLKPGSRYCAFKPRVIIIDNWGWCNGTCQNGGCWGQNENQLRDDYNTCVDPQHRDYRSGKVGTPFDGWIIVAEQK